MRLHGLFPAPAEIKLSCNCPDWADMCKHVAAVLYGVGARLDEQPRLLFVLRGADETELIAGAGQDLAPKSAPVVGDNVLADGDVAALFGIEMAEAETAQRPAMSPRAAKARAVKAPGDQSRKTPCCVEPRSGRSEPCRDCAESKAGRAARKRPSIGSALPGS